MEASMNRQARFDLITYACRLLVQELLEAHYQEQASRQVHARHVKNDMIDIFTNVENYFEIIFVEEYKDKFI